MKYTTDSQFNGRETLKIWNDNADISKGSAIVGFQLRKAKAIVESIEVIKAFVAQEMAKEVIATEAQK